MRNKLKTKLMPPGAEEEMAHMALVEAILEKPYRRREIIVRRERELR